MPVLVTPEFRRTSRRKRNFNALYGAMVLLSLHWAIVLYINSSFVGQFVDKTTVGLLYTVSSAVCILCFLFISRVLHKAGNYNLTLVGTLIEFVALIGMAYTDSLRIAIPLFLIHQAIAPLILFNLDIYLEEMIGDNEDATGGRRGFLLVIMSLAGAMAPLIMSALMGESASDFSPVYIVSALFLIPFLIVIMRYFRTFQDPAYTSPDILSAIRNFWVHKNIRFVFLSHFLLQLFFAWMVIYTPIYLSESIGFSWDIIGKILFAGLIAYVVLEYPIGRIADEWIGEKEMMAAGFCIIALSTAWFTFLGGTSVALWMLAMFATRVGASLVETTTESYFFKHTRGSDANVISFFRITRPLSIVVGSLLGSLTLLYVPIHQIFIILGALMLPGLFFTLKLKDTK